MNDITKKFNSASESAGFDKKLTFSGDLSKLEGTVLVFAGNFEDGTPFSSFRAGDGYKVTVVGEALTSLPKGESTLFSNKAQDGWILFRR